MTTTCNIESTRSMKYKMRSEKGLNESEERIIKMWRALMMKADLFRNYLRFYKHIFYVKIYESKEMEIHV